MKKRSSKIYIDIDGTLIDFKKVDNAIIKKIFSKNSIIMLLDNILWKINDLDLIGYSRCIFYLRMFIYSLIGFVNINFVLTKYERMYYLLAKEQITKDKIKKVEMLKNLGYDVCFITRNMYAKHLIKHIGFKTIVVKNKRKYYLKNISNIAYIIGNNFSDDIVSGYIVNFKNNIIGNNEYVTGIYIGKSKIVERIMSLFTLSFEDLDSCIEYFLLKHKNY